MGIIAFIILGLLAGPIAKAIMPGKDPGGYIVTAVIGIVGALARRLSRRCTLRRASARRVLRHLDVADGHRRLDHPARDLPRGRRSERRSRAASLSSQVFPYSRSLRSASRTTEQPWVDQQIAGPTPNSAHEEK